MYSIHRNIVYLIAEYLKEAGLQKSHSTLIEETQLSSEFSVCDNVDLETIYLEFCSYFQIKFGKKPRFVKKLDQNIPKPPSFTSVERQNLTKRRAALKTAPTHVLTTFPEISVAKEAEVTQCLRVSSLSPPTHDDNIIGKHSSVYPRLMTNEDFNNSHPCDWKEMTEIIMTEVIKKDLCVKWDDVVGQDSAKQIIQESVIFPTKYPQLFNRVQPWKGL